MLYVADDLLLLKVVSKRLARFPHIGSVDVLVEVIATIQECFICVGNPDTKFEQLALSKKGEFTNARGSYFLYGHVPVLIGDIDKGTEITAVVESQVTGTATIRHKNCEYLLDRGQARCSQCQNHRKSLHVMLKRLQTRTISSTNASSHANYRYLSRPLLVRRAHNIRKKYRLAQRRVARLRVKVKQLVAKNGVKVTPRLKDDLRQIMQDNLADIARKYPPNTFQRVFWEQHAKSSACKGSRGIRWHPAMIRWCLYLRHLSGKAYEVMRSSGVLQLPSQRTLRDYTHFIPATTGYSNPVDNMLFDTLKVDMHSCLLCQY